MEGGRSPEVRCFSYNPDKTKTTKEEVDSRAATINDRESQKAGEPSRVGESGLITGAIVSRVRASVSIHYMSYDF